MPNKIKKYRLLSGLTQEEVAKELDICKQSYSNKENEVTDFTKGEMEKLYNLFSNYLPELSFVELFNLS